MKFQRVLTICLFLNSVYRQTAEFPERENSCFPQPDFLKGRYKLFSISWTLYDHDTVERIIRDNPDLLPLPEVNIPLDRRWNKEHVNNAILQGILQGDSIPKIAQRLENILGMDHRAAVRSARTATTAAECAGRLDTYKYAESLGIKLQKQWLATLDDRTRHAHRQLDGQTVDIGKNFEIDGYELEYPGDPKAPGYLIYNCRCTTITVDKFHDKNAPRASRLKEVTYDEWKEGQNGKPNRKWGVLGGNSQKTVENNGKSGIMVSDKADSVSARNSAVGKPNFVNAGASLSKRQTALLDSLRNDGDFVTVSKRDCSLIDISALSAHEGVEFAMLTRKGERMIFRGNDHHVNSLNGETVPQYRDAGWKWSGHTHVYGGVIPSDGDQKILALFGQQKSVIYDYAGSYFVFHRK